MKRGYKKRLTATFLTDWGPITLEADDLGLTGIMLPVPSRLHAEPAKEVMPDNAVLRDAVRQINEYLQGGRTSFELPLNVIGTAFQKKVWNIIGSIPYGRTLSYGDIARRLGGAGKSRAVGGAAHANPLPLVIPCHRVIGSDGSLTGFGGGLDLKKKLLELEKKNR